MKLIISHRSAMLFWKRFRGSTASLPKVDNPSPMEHPVVLSSTLKTELCLLGFAVDVSNPLDLLFSTSGVRSRSRLYISHRGPSHLPDGSLLQLSEHVAIVSPALCFAQASRAKPYGQLLMDGCEMCGTYRLLGDDGRPLAKPGKREPLTSAKEMQATATALGLGREAKASRAARFVFDNAASPMEARLALLLSLPQTAGGFGLPRPELNAPIYLGRAAYRVYPCSPCRMDLFWRSVNLDIEYDGGDHNEDTRVRDAARIVALRMEKMDVLVLRKQQVYDVRSMAAIARMIAGKLGHVLRISTRDFELRHQRLRREIGLY